MPSPLVTITVAIPLELSERLSDLVARLNDYSGTFIHTEHLRASRGRKITRSSLVHAMLDCEIDCYEDMLREG